MSHFRLTDAALCKENLRIAKARAEEEQPVVYITIKKLAPAPRSRIIGPQIEYAKTGEAPERQRALRI